MMRNNQRLQSIGIPVLASIVNNTSAKTKASARANSGSLYEPGDDDNNEEGVVEKVYDNAPLARVTHNTQPAGGSRGSKRVTAPPEQGHSDRVTRQRTKEHFQTEEVHPLGLSAAIADSSVDVCSPNQGDDQIQLGNEDASNAMVDRWNRGRSIGRDLGRINRSICTKLPVHVAEGKKRPEVPIQAAKLASEGGIVLRQHIPILPHWKDYKKDESHLKNYMGKVNVHVTIDTTSKSVTYACADLLKSGQRQMRYRLKKQFFDGIPANEVRTTSPLKSISNEQWKALVEKWSGSKHKETCVKNNANREKVQFHQKTGSRCYIAHCHVMKEKYKDEQPNAFDLFKDCHCSSKTGFSEPVKKAIADMEAIMAEPVQDGQEPKSATEAVCQVLPSTKFLQNVSLESAVPKKSRKAAVDARVQELEGALEIEKQGAANLREKLDGQQEELDNVKKQFEASNAKHQEEIAILKKQSEEAKKASDETNALLCRLLCPDKV